MTTAKCRGFAGGMRHLLSVGSRKGVGHSLGSQWAVSNSLFAHFSPTEAGSIWLNLIKSLSYGRWTVAVPINYPPALQLVSVSREHFSYITGNAARENYSNSAPSAHSFALSPASGDVLHISVAATNRLLLVCVRGWRVSLCTFINQEEQTQWQQRKRAELLQESIKHELFKRPHSTLPQPLLSLLCLCKVSAKCHRVRRVTHIYIIRRSNQWQKMQASRDHPQISYNDPRKQTDNWRKTFLG